MSRKKVILLFWLLVFFLLVIGFLIWLIFFRLSTYTDDAYVEGNQVFITPLKDGFITAIHTDDTFFVKKGDLLIELDKSDNEIQLNQAAKELAIVVREVSELFHQVFVYKAEIEIKKAEFIKAAQDYKHREDVIASEGVSQEDFEHAIAAFRSSFFSLWMTETLYEKALSLVQGTSIKTHPKVLAAIDRVRNAWLQLYRCNIYSPVEGLAAQRKIQVGMWVHAGEPLLSVIPLDQMWVNANYKETQLKHMRMGQNVHITSDLYGRGVVFHGKVVGLPGAAGNAFSLLPPENLSGNWIKIVQRLPVRVALLPDEIKAHPLRIGLSMEATVDLVKEDENFHPCSPSYVTSIFCKEEEGDGNFFEKIIEENLDPTLSKYYDEPLQIETRTRSQEIDCDLDALKNYALKFS